MQKRFGTLDCLRGIAAVAVVAFHVGQVKIVSGLAPHAYLAVDLFFMLSGFVITRTYEQKIIKKEISVREFLVLRAIRLYPLIILGVILGALVTLLKAYVDPARSLTPAMIFIDNVANLFLLPAPLVGGNAHGFLFPGNGVLWSLLFEVAINAVWSIWLARMQTSRIIFIVAGAFFYMVAAIVYTGTANLGYDWTTFFCGIARVTYGFGLGQLIFRAMPSFSTFKGIAFKGASIGLLVATMLCPFSAAFGGLFDVLAIGFILPLVLLLGINAADHKRFDIALGEMSYPLYVVHFPILLMASGLHQKFPSLSDAILIAIIAVALAMSTLLILFYFDRPVRATLMLLKRKIGSVDSFSLSSLASSQDRSRSERMYLR